MSDKGWREKALKSGSYFKEGRATFVGEARPRSRQVFRRELRVYAKGEPHEPRKKNWRDVLAENRA